MTKLDLLKDTSYGKRSLEEAPRKSPWKLTSAMIYDAGFALGLSMLAQGTTPQNMAHILSRIHQTDSNVKHLRFDKFGDVMFNGYVVWRVVDGLWHPVSHTYVD